jgi:hypothetical protein
MEAEHIGGIENAELLKTIAYLRKFSKRLDVIVSEGKDDLVSNKIFSLYRNLLHFRKEVSGDIDPSDWGYLIPFNDEKVPGEIDPFHWKRLGLERLERAVFNVHFSHELQNQFGLDDFSEETQRLLQEVIKRGSGITEKGGRIFMEKHRDGTESVFIRGKFSKSDTMTALSHRRTFKIHDLEKFFRMTLPEYLFSEREEIVGYLYKPAIQRRLIERAEECYGKGIFVEGGAKKLVNHFFDSPDSIESFKGKSFSGRKNALAVKESNFRKNRNIIRVCFEELWNSLQLFETIQTATDEEIRTYYDATIFNIEKIQKLNNDEKEKIQKAKEDEEKREKTGTLLMSCIDIFDSDGSKIPSDNSGKMRALKILEPEIFQEAKGKGICLEYRSYEE